MTRTEQQGPVAVAVLCLVQFVDVLSVTVVVTALPAMLTDLGAPPSTGTLVVTGYAMFFGGLLMLGARLGDRYGPRRVLLLGLAGFAAASLVAATAGSAALLVAARCAMGAAAAVSVPTALRMLSVGTGDRRRRALAAWSATGAAAGASGLLLGGVLTDLAGWRTVFWVNVPVAVGLAVAVTAVVRAPRARPGLRLDLAGAAVLTTAVMAVVSGSSLVERDLRGVGLLVAGAGLAAVFVRVERRAVDPLLPGAAVRHPGLRAGVAVSAVNTATTSSAVVLATLYLQDELGASATAAGLWLLPFSLSVVLGAAVAAPLTGRQGSRAVAVLGLGVVAGGLALLVPAPAVPWVLPVAVAVAGLGLGLASVAANALGTDVPGELAGTSSGALNTAAQLGTAVGVAAFVLLATGTDGLTVGGTPLAWAGAAALASLTAVVVRRPRPGRRASGTRWRGAVEA